MREEIISKTIALLRKKKFTVSTFLNTNTCFDIVARREDLTLLFKIFDNVDGVRQEQAMELKKLASLFGATTIILGSKTKAFVLKENIIYSRYGISTLSLVTLSNFLYGDVPSISFFKGKEIVEIDPNRMKELRSEKGISMKQLAEKIDSTVESVYRYEHGAKASLLTAEKIEKILEGDLVKEIDLFESEPEEFGEEEPEDETLLKLKSLGSKISVFSRAPFRAISSRKESILVEKAGSKTEIKKKSIELDKARKPFNSYSILISKKIPARQIGQTPVIEEEELSSLSRFRELIELIREREQLK